ncbi:MAG: hypothetical protein ACJAVK_001241 [Akkermansiaceae bacterium]|jgi:hypothetical protein
MSTGSTLLTSAQIESVTDDQDGRAGFVSIFSAPDGLTYFYENDSDSILSMDPNDPVNSLSVVLTEDELINGPAGSDVVGQLTWYDGEIVWTNLRQDGVVLSMGQDPVDPTNRGNLDDQIPS